MTTLAADSCMAPSSEGEVCTAKEFHSGEHSWGKEAVQTTITLKSDGATVGPVADKPQRNRVVLRAPTEEEFDGQDFLASAALTDLAGELIVSCPELRHLGDAAMGFLWKRKGGASKGKSTLGKCQKPSGLLAHFARYDFIVWLAADHATEYQFSGVQLEALLYHELCHADLDEDEETGDRQWTIKPHDVEAFGSEVRRYGLIFEDVRSFAKEAARQLTLDEAQA
jgi:Putative phage metallopeptidase